MANNTVPNGTAGPSQAATPAANEEPLPAGWEMRFDSYGRR